MLTERTQKEILKSKFIWFTHSTDQNCQAYMCTMSYVKKGIEKQDIMHALGVTCLVLLHLIAMHLSYVQCSSFNSFFSLQNRRNTIIELYTCWLILLVTYSLIFIIIPQYLVSIPLFPSGFQEDTNDKFFWKGSQWKILR